MDACLKSLGSEKIFEPLQPGKRAGMRDCSIVLAHWHRLGDGSVMREVSAAAGPAQRRGSQDACHIHLRNGQQDNAATKVSSLWALL